MNAQGLKQNLNSRSMVQSKEEFFTRQDFVFSTLDAQHESVGSEPSIASSITPAPASARQDMILGNNPLSRIAFVPPKRTRAASSVSVQGDPVVQNDNHDAPEDPPSTPQKKSKAKVSSSRSTSRRKKLFADLVFLFIPNSTINAARKLRMQKVEALGGTLVSSFDADRVTHIIADHNITTSILLKHLNLDQLPRHVAVYNEAWTPECVMYGKLLAPAPKFMVDGYVAPEEQQQPLVPSQTQSLQVKKGKKNTRRQSSTDQSSSLGPVSAEEPLVPSTPEKVVKTHSSASVDELEAVISTVKALGTVHLSDESSSSDNEPAPGDTMNQKFKCMQGNDITRQLPESPNAFVIEKLKVMQRYYETSRAPEDKFKPRSYQRAIDSLKAQKEPITTYVQAIALPHVGERLANHIVEIAKTGTYARLDNLGNDYEVVQKFMGIYGVGPGKANEYVRSGYRTFDDLVNSGVLNKNQKVGVELYEDLNTRIPRAEVELIKDFVVREGAKIDPSLQIYVMGSYRRGEADCGDVDFMLTRKNTTQRRLVSLWQKLLNVLQNELKFLTHALITSDTLDGLKWQGIGRLPNPDSLHRRIDFLLVPWEQRGAALLYFTGNELFNRSLRLLARKKGYTLNEKGLMQGALRGSKGAKLTTGTNTGLETEEEILACLGVPYLPPHERCIS